MAVGGLPGAGEFVGDVGGCPVLFALVGAHAHEQLAVAHFGFGAVGFGSAEGVPGGPPGGVGLDLPGLGCRADRGGGVVVAGQFAVRGDGAGPLLPRVALLVVVGDLAERLDRPLRLVVGDLLAEFVAACVGGRGELGRGSRARPGRRRQGSSRRGGRRSGRAMTASLMRWWMTLVSCRAPVEVAAGDGVVEDVSGVVAGEFGLAEHAVEVGGAVLGGELRRAARG